MTSSRHPRESQNRPSSPLQAVEPTLVIQLPSRRGPVIAVSLLATLCVGIVIAVLSGDEAPATGAHLGIVAINESGKAATQPPPASSPAAPGTANPAPGGEGTAEELPAARVAALPAGQRARPNSGLNARSANGSTALASPGPRDQTAAGAESGAGEAAVDTDEQAAAETAVARTRTRAETSPDSQAARSTAAAAREAVDRPSGEDTARQPDPPLPARVDIRSTPAGATVRIDGRIKGETPLAGLQMDAGKAHAIELSRTGYETWRGRVQPVSGQVTAVAASLEPVAQPAETAAPARAASPSSQRDVLVPRSMVGSADRGKGLFARCQACHGSTAPGLSPQHYTQKQWIRYLASTRHGRHDPLGARFDQAQLADVKAYLLANAADVDRAMVPGVR